MAMENKRITQLSTERLTLTSGDYVLVDDANNGSAKYRLDKLKETDSTLSVSDMAANAAATGSAISDEATARELADTAIGEDIDDLKSATESLEDQMTQKADIDGFYEDMTVGTAEAVLSETFTADSIPYHFRKTPYGDRLKEKIIGGTVAWNQLVKNGDFASNTEWIKISVSATIANGEAIVTAIRKNGALNQKCNITPNHKYLASVKVKASSSIPLRLYMSDDENYTVFSDIDVGTSYAYYSAIFAIGNTISDDNNRIGLQDTASSNWVQFTVDDFMLIDLTALFGSTIADYIYNLEQTTAGSGVALFRELFPKDYYEYDAGSLQSVSGLQSHDEVGFNQWDEEWESGFFNTNTGVKINSATRIRCKNPIKVFPSTTYYIKNVSGTNVYCFAYDVEMNLIDYWTRSNSLLVTPANCYYLNIAMYDDYGTTYNNDICINISDPSKNGTYEPYKKHSYPLDSSLTLRGVPKLVDNKIQFDGDVYESDGKVTRRYKENTVTITTIYTRDTNPNCDFAVFAVTDTWKTSGYFLKDLISDKMYPSTYSFDSVSNSGYVIIYSTGSKQLSVSVPKGTTLAQAKTLFDGAKIVYKVAEPIEESATEYTNPQRCAEGGTEEYVTTGIVPVGHESEYYENIAAKVDGLPYDLSMIAPIENGDTASKAYSVGQYFLHNDQFCKAKTAIASGATFTLNTNYEVTTVANELYTALHS